MLFPTTQFLIFFCIVFTLHWALNRFPNVDKAMLLAASWVFYAAWNPWFVIPLMASAGISWAAGWSLAHANAPASRHLITAGAVTGHLLLLGFFKYFEFLARTLQTLGAQAGLMVPLPGWDIVLPVGISFFTFQGIS